MKGSCEGCVKFSLSGRIIETKRSTSKKEFYIFAMKFEFLVFKLCQKHERRQQNTRSSMFWARVLTRAAIQHGINKWLRYM